MSSSRRRSARPDPARRRQWSNLEVLESRQLLTQTPYSPIKDYPSSDTLPFQHPGQVPTAQIAHPIGTNPAILATYQNEGKVLTGQDRQGNRWHLKLTGPGQIIVTDTSPNDGVLDDDINTIRLVGTSPTKSVLTGTVEQSARILTDTTQLPTLGTMYFNRLEALQGVKSIILNGFILTDTITPPGSAVLSPAEASLNQTTGINLQGGVGTLSFQGIDARFPATFAPVPITISIGSSTTPLTVHPNIRIDSIVNTVYDDTAFTTTTGSQTIPTGPLTSPTVSLVVNGTIANFDVVSITQQPNLSTLFPPLDDSKLVIPTQLIPSDTAALEYQFPTVGTTGRTAVQTTAIGNIKVSGAATNVTFSKSTKPFQSSLTGLNSVGSAQFGGTTDAVAIDSRGSIGSLTFAKGLGNPAGTIINPINYGQPASQNGYAASGNIAVQIVTEGNIGSLTAGPVGQFFQISQDPAQIQAGLNGYTSYVNRPGTAVTSSLVAAAGSIGSTHIVGDLQNSEIKSGYNYTAAIGGSDGVSGTSSIGPATIRGNVTNSVVAASYRPNDGIYGNGNDTAGNGTITGTFAGQIYKTTGGKTVLGNSGSGFFAKYTSAPPEEVRSRSESGSDDESPPRFDRSLKRRSVRSGGFRSGRLLVPRLTTSRAPCPSSGRPRNRKSARCRLA